MTRYAIDPVTRIEGHLRIEIEASGGYVRDAWSTRTMFRGIEEDHGRSESARSLDARAAGLRR